MSISNEQVEAAAEATYNALREPHNAAWDELPEGGLKRRRFLLVARAALEAGEAAAWSTDMEAAPDYEEVLLHVPPFAPMQGTRSGRFKTWMVGARSIIGRDLGPDNSPRMWRPLPTPPTEGDR